MLALLPKTAFALLFAFSDLSSAIAFPCREKISHTVNWAAQLKLIDDRQVVVYAQDLTKGRF